jgi:phosphomannomutase
MPDINARTKEWIAGDPDPATRAEMQALLDAGADDELADRMGAVLVFGTAGLRGRVEAGSNRMNRATVIRATRGLADHLLAGGGEDRGPVVVGRDARISSEVFMEDTVGVLAAAGFDVVYFVEPTPTPIVAYTARILAACSAIVITASHNPPADNGYKVYAGNAAQIIPPVDAEIAAAIATVGPANRVPMVEDPYRHPNVSPAPDDVEDRYLFEVAAAVPDVTGDRSISIVYTPLHGVGGRWVVGALERFGFRHVHPVAGQWEPDGRFPTVSFPNPEEPGALDLAHELAAAVDADLVLANDPDTDRLSVSLPDLAGGWRQLTGNQVGSLLAEFMLAHAKEEAPIVISSVVSSPHLARVAQVHGALVERTLTGFKWIWNAGLLLEAQGRGRYLFGYEEALGYSVGRTVRDKDGISAAVAFAILAAATAAAGGAVWDRLADLAARDGLWVSVQRSVLRPGAEGAREIAAAMDGFAEQPPRSLDGHPVTSTLDYRDGADRRPPWLAATPLLELSLGDTGRALIRPSGTEPKLKVYVDLRGPFAAGGDWFGAEAELCATAVRIADAVVAHLGLT